MMMLDGGCEKPHVVSLLVGENPEQHNHKSTHGVCLGKESVVPLCKQSWQCSRTWVVPNVEEIRPLSDSRQATLTAFTSLWETAVAWKELGSTSHPLLR